MGMMTEKQVTQKIGGSGISFQCKQIKNVLTNELKQFKLTTFEVIITSIAKQRLLLSKVYDIVLQLVRVDDNPKRTWETDLGEEITERDWERTNKYGHTVLFRGRN